MAVAEGPFHTPALRVAFRANAENRILSHPPVSNRRLTNIHQHSIPSFLSSLSLIRVTHPVEKEKKKERKSSNIEISHRWSFRNRTVSNERSRQLITLP